MSVSIVNVDILGENYSYLEELNIGWVDVKETQQKLIVVGLRCRLTQPTPFVSRVAKIFTIIPDC
ncbi:hypothetical protein [Okeania sp. KiyG1]|uniref:hypothetical protein n=1 Tax=Okeania sp. KiyG1 TaxID=2720165 RepID=UPI0019217B67|nr:hypothetical protein [Okeania sp. KiyG1]GGA14567.1 hypothetical protein CYANOKiyG1_28200 [Okeania sp. KiyG1]